ncbi:hypothetical protein FGO68_gene16140 [Halteria grandinella]|uniref:Protein kinase domain-containing protein n=1 Tax=Halteria grandinella TaxID=5974 RepID=A0A8J8NUT4_HALGN|nr:hypothetical protein FGO68_gene16140 [Halteria grandinella]
MEDSILKPVNGKYKQLKILGQGTYGVVWRVQNTDDGQQYAMKIEKKQNDEVNRQFSYQQFVNEIEFLKLNEHPYIIKYIESFSYYDKKQDFIARCIVYELADPQNLFEIVKSSEKGIPEDLALTWFTQICLALSYLHERGLMHRDIKPRNILLVREEDQLVAKIADFGTIKEDYDGQENTVIIGTSKYQPPERVGQNYSGKADVWALGIILYIMLTKQHPFPGADRDDQSIPQMCIAITKQFATHSDECLNKN